MAPKIKANALILLILATLFLLLFSSSSAIVDPNLTPAGSVMDKEKPPAAAVRYAPRKEKKPKGPEVIPGNGEGASGDLLPTSLRDKIAKEHGYRHENAKLADKKMKDAAGDFAKKAKEKVPDVGFGPSATEGVIPGLGKPKEAKDALKDKIKKAKHHLKGKDDEDELTDKPKKAKHHLKDEKPIDTLKDKPKKTRHHLKDEEAEDALKPGKAKHHPKDEEDEDESKDKPKKAKKAKHGLKDKEVKDAFKDEAKKAKKHLKDEERKDKLKDKPKRKHPKRIETYEHEDGKVKIKIPKEKKSDDEDDKMPKKKNGGEGKGV